MMKLILSLAVVGISAPSALLAQAAVRIERVDVGGVQVTIRYLDGRMARLSPRPESLVRDAWPRLVKLFGGQPLKLTRVPYDTFVINLSYGLGEGRSAPQQISLQTNPDTLAFGYASWEIAVLHELVHFWNANTFDGASGNEQWFTEGVTEYYALRLARELRLLSGDQLAATMAMLFGYYASDAGIGTLSLASAGNGAYRTNHYFLVYAGGATAAMVLDFEVRLATKGASTLDDLVRVMYRDNDAGVRRFTNASVRRALETLTGKSYQDFFARFVEGTEIIPVGHYFSVFDLFFLDIPQRVDRNSEKSRILRAMFDVP